MSMVHVNTGGAVAWAATHIDCRRCHQRRTFLGRMQPWYDTDWVCLNCGAMASEQGWRWGSPRRDRSRALAWRRAFAAWLLAGSPRLEQP